MEKKCKSKRKHAAILFAFGMILSFLILGNGQTVRADEVQGDVFLKETEVIMAPATIKKLKLNGASSGVKWTSSNKKIAAVDSAGVVTAKAKGTADITAAYDGTEYVCSIKVRYATYTTSDQMVYKDVKGSFGYTGRWFKKRVGGGNYYFTNTDGGAIYFKVTGSKYVNVNFVSNTVRGIPYFAYSIDGGKMKRQLVSHKKIKVGNSRKTHYVRLLIDATSEYEDRWKSEAGVGIKSISPVTKGGVVTAVKPENDIIAFYGDSITKGVRTLDMGTPSGTSVTNSYAWHCAKQLNFVPYFAGFGASGIVQQGTADSCINVIGKVSASRKAASFNAEVIVIEHGTNDVYTHGDIYVGEYQKVIQTLHNQHPKAHIMAMIPLNQIHAEDIRRAAAPYKKWCTVVETAGLKLAYMDGIHPNAAGSKKMGKYLAKKITAAIKKH